MPYIKPERRPALKNVGSSHCNNAGELNFKITMVIKQYVESQGQLSYQTINDVIGALEGAKAEFQRRIVAPYEDSKIATNGDVYD